MTKKVVYREMVRDLELQDLAVSDVAIGAERAARLVAESVTMAKDSARANQPLKSSRHYATALVIALQSERIHFAEVMTLIDSLRDALKVRATTEYRATRKPKSSKQIRDSTHPYL